MTAGDAVARPSDRRGLRSRSAIRGRASLGVGRAIAALDAERGGWIAFGVAAAASLALSLWLTRGTTFWLDETYFFSGDRGFDLQYLLTPHNGQLILGPRFVYAAVFKLFGADYIVFRVIEAVGVVLVATLVYALSRRRIRGALALPGALIMLFFGAASGTTVAPLGMINVYCVAAGLGAILALERRGRLADPLAALLLAVSLSFWSPGLAFAAGALVLILRDPGWRRRLWVVAAPVGLYALWWVTKPGLTGPLYGTLELKASNVLLIPSFSVDSLGWIASGVTGVDYGFNQPPAAFNGPIPDNLWGPVLATIALAGLVIGLRRIRASTWPWPWIAILVVLWASTALAASPLRTPGTARYVYVGAAAALVLAADVAGRFRLGRRVVIASFAVAILSLGANIAMLRDASTYLRANAASVRADLAAVELARRHVSPSFLPSVGAISSPILAPAAAAGTYLAAVDRNGSFADTVPELQSAAEGPREEADQILAQALRLGLAPAPNAAPAGGCHAVASSPGAPATFRLPPGGALLRSSDPRPATVELRRFASAFTAPLGSLPPGGYYSLAIPPDGAPNPWWAQVAARGQVTVCPR